MRDIYLVIDAVIAVGLLALSIISLLKQGYKKSVNRLFAAFSILVALWIVSNHISNDINLPNQVALVADYIVFSSSFGVAILLMQFVVKLADVERIEKIVNWALVPLWGLCIICATPLVVAGVVVQDNVYAVKFGPLTWLYALGLFLMVWQIAYGIVHGLRYAQGVKKRQLMTIAAGLTVTIPFVLLFSFIIPVTTGLFSVTEFGITPGIILVISLYYSVVRFSLFDIRLAAVRTAAYVMSLLTLSVIYFFIAYVVSIVLFNGNISSSVSINPINIVLALLLAFIFQPVKYFFDKLTNKFFYKDNYDTDDFFTHLNKTLTFTTDLRGLLERAANEIGHTLKSEQAFFFINMPNGHCMSVGTAHHRLLPKEDVVQLDAVQSNDHSILVASLRASDDPIRRLMISHRLEIILPLIQSDKMIGYLCLGDHLMSGYTNRDMKVLGAISDELTIAIQNALAVQEIREFNVTLQQRIENATKELRTSNSMLRKLDKSKDEFVSMASHQLRTPLTSVKGYISMVLEGDAGKITNTQRQLLDEAFTSSERMVRLISDFLNVSRLQTGKFIIDKHPIDLAKLVEQEIDSLQSTALARNLKFIYNPPTNLPMVNVDESKIRQVVMNFADNALYYSHDNSVINVNLSVNGGNVIFTVKDSGIGVPISEQEQLFTKFYRASNARKQRPDGTGVGLYLAKRIINAHDGKVIFSSSEDNGSTFGFSLPIKNN